MTLGFNMTKAYRERGTGTFDPISGIPAPLSRGALHTVRNRVNSTVFHFEIVHDVLVHDRYVCANDD